MLVSVHRPSESAKTQAACEIPFPVLGDPELALHKAQRGCAANDGCSLT